MRFSTRLIIAIIAAVLLLSYATKGYAAERVNVSDCAVANTTRTSWTCYNQNGQLVRVTSLRHHFAPVQGQLRPTGEGMVDRANHLFRVQKA